MKAAISACVLLLLAGCGARANWTKAGADEAAVAHEYADCRDLAAAAVKPQADIDQDIAATRSDDRQRAGIVRAQTQTSHEQTRDRAAAIVAKCMSAKGFVQPP